MSLQQIDRLTDSQITELHQLFQNEWWTNERSLADVRIMVENSSLIVGFADSSGRLVAFSRVLTDFVFRVTIYDVIVAEPDRGQGLGRILMEAISKHPRLQRVSTLWLCCHPDMIPFYERWGFQPFHEGPQWMLKAQRPG